MKLIKLINGYIEENCYLIGDDNCYIIDPGFGINKTVEAIENNFKGVKAILLTHSHFDHVGIVDRLVEKYNCPVYLNDLDKDFIDGKHIPLLHMGSAVVTLKTPTIDVFKLNDSNIEVLHTPGHSAGSVCYIFKEENIMFSGDTLFKNNIGRTDFYSSNEEEMIKTLKMLKSLDKNYTIYPGHGQETTLDIEKESNYYLSLI